MASPPSSDYTLGSGQAERERLRRQSSVVADWCTALLDRGGLEPGDRVIDVGCGPVGALDLLSCRVGPTGRVVGMDKIAAHVTEARAWCEERGLRNVQVLQGDARDTGLAGGSFDAVHARLILINIPRPGEVVAEMARLIRRGGVVMLHEPDFASFYCDPPNPAWDRLLDAIHAVFDSVGSEWTVARQVPRLLAQAGLVGEGVDVRVTICPPGHIWRPFLLDFAAQMRDRILGLGVLTDAELRTLLAQLREHLEDPRTLVVSHLHIQAWARKP